MESVLRHYPQMNYDEYKDDVFIKEFIEMFDNDDNSILVNEILEAEMLKAILDKTIEEWEEEQNESK